MAPITLLDFFCFFLQIFFSWTTFHTLRFNATWITNKWSIDYWKNFFKKQIEDYTGLQDRIDKLKEKYRLLRDQKIKERVETLGVKLQGDEDRETLLEKEKEYTLARQKIEFALESFYRSASSLVFQLNKRHITRDMSIFRCIDRRFETGEVFIKWDESSDDEWLLLIYIKNNSEKKLQDAIFADERAIDLACRFGYSIPNAYKSLGGALKELIEKTRKKKKRSFFEDRLDALRKSAEKARSELSQQEGSEKSVSSENVYGQ